MYKNLIAQIALNTLVVTILLSFLIFPIYFIDNVGKIAGVKNNSKFLVVSQIEKFPNLSLVQSGNSYKVSLNKIGDSQAYLGVFIINNPTDKSQKYKIEKTNDNSNVFFGEDLNNQKTTISALKNTSVSISLISNSGNELNQDIEFNIEAE